MKTARCLSSAAVAISIASGFASAQTVPPAGRMYVYHSPPKVGCPGLDWLIISGQSGDLSGMIAWDGMASMAKAQGSIKDGQVQMTATEVGGQGRTATLTGTVDAKGWLVLNFTTPNAKCEGVNVPFYAP
jgi:hypothetical protein